jgi:hypothetical protein
MSDLSDHDADLGAHDGAILVITMARYTQLVLGRLVRVAHKRPRMRRRERCLHGRDMSRVVACPEPVWRRIVHGPLATDPFRAEEGLVRCDLRANNQTDDLLVVRRVEIELELRAVERPLDAAPVAQRLVERLREHERLAIADLMAHPDDDLDVLGDRHSLRARVTGHEHYTANTPGMLLEDPGHGLRVGRVSVAQRVFEQQLPRRRTMTAEVEDLRLVGVQQVREVRSR